MHRIGKDTMLYLLNKKKMLVFFFFVLTTVLSKEKMKLKRNHNQQYLLEHRKIQWFKTVDFSVVGNII